MTRLLILNVHSGQNAGDAALLAVTAAELRRLLPQARLTVAVNDPLGDELRSLELASIPSAAAQVGGQPLRALAGLLRPRQAWPELLRAIDESDAVLSCAGNPFFSMGRVGWPLLVALAPLQYALRAGKPLFILPQSVGPFYRGWEERLTAGIFRRAAHIYVRDALSLRLLQSWGIARARLAYAPDPAFLLRPASRTTALDVLQRSGFQMGRPALGVSLIPQMVRTLPAAQLTRLEDALVPALTALARANGLQICFFPQVSGPTVREDDRLPIRRVLARLPADVAAFELRGAPSAELLKACYGCMDAVLAARLHAGIFALGMGVPVLWVGYLTKTRGLLESLDLLPWLLPLEEAAPLRMQTALEQLWRQRQTYAAHLPERLPALRAAARRPFAELAEQLLAREL